MIFIKSSLRMNKLQAEGTNKGRRQMTEDRSQRTEDGKQERKEQECRAKLGKWKLRK